MIPGCFTVWSCNIKQIEPRFKWSLEKHRYASREGLLSRQSVTPLGTGLSGTNGGSGCNLSDMEAADIGECRAISLDAINEYPINVVVDKNEGSVSETDSTFWF
jgi:hypothetical protein